MLIRLGICVAIQIFYAKHFVPQSILKLLKIIASLLSANLALKTYPVL